MISLVVFDMAGTTVEEGGAVYRAIADAVSAHLGHPVPDDELERWTGAEKREAIAGLLSSLDGPSEDPVVDRVFADFSGRLDDAYLTAPPTPIPGAAELFAHLHRRGIKVALTTGFSNRVADHLLDRLGWTVGDEVDAVVTAEQVGAGRPSPLMIQRAAQLTGVSDPDELLVVGDTVRDLEAGRNAGVRAVVGVLTGAQDESRLSEVPGARILSSCTELPALIDELDGAADPAAATATPNAADRAGDADPVAATATPNPAATPNAADRAGDARRPNVLLVTLDQFRGDCLGVAGHPLVRTPTLDRLASQGVRFANHYSNCAPCAPARASLLTGLWQMNHRVTFNGAPLRDDLPMLPRLLRDHGYDPTLFGYSDTTLDPATLAEDDPRLHIWEQPMPGFAVGLHLDDDISTWIDWLAGQGLDVPEEQSQIYDPAPVEIPPGRGATWRPARYSAEQTEAAFMTETVLDWLRSPDRRDEPWCAHVSYLRPHPPYLAPAPYHDMFDPADVPAPVRRASAADEAALHPFLAGALTVVPSPVDELDQRQLQATYYGMIAEVDHQLGLLLDGVDSLGMGDDTIVVVTSDHGEQLGDHWLVEKLGFFRQSYHIPLIVRLPGAPVAGAVVDAFTEAVDVVPTLLDLVGAPAPELCDGASLRPFLQGEPTPPSWRDAVHHEFDFRDPVTTNIEKVFGVRQDQCAISVLRDRTSAYVQFCGGLPPLYFDLEQDPGELVDLAAGRASDPGVAAAMLDRAQRLLALRMEHTDPRLANTRATPRGTVHRADPPRFAQR